jgi:hypothetical protein
MELEAPKDRQRPQSRLNWLLRQLANADPSDIHVRCKWPGRTADTQAALIDVRSKPELVTGDNEAGPHSFVVLLVRDIAHRFSGAKTFIEHLETIVPHFYSEIGERLRAYVPLPPKIQDGGERANEADQPAASRAATASAQGGAGSAQDNSSPQLDGHDEPAARDVGRENSVGVPDTIITGSVGGPPETSSTVIAEPFQSNIHRKEPKS